MIFVVSGYRRSGTSAMMQALGMGGIPILSIPDIDVMNVEADGYRINPFGLYEISRAAYMEPFVLQQILQDGFAIKIFFDGLPTLPAGDYRVLFMQRDEAEINASLARTRGVVKGAGLSLEAGGKKPFDVYSPYAQKEIDWVLGICEQRKDMDVSVVDYHQLVKDPRATLKSLNLPIDIDKAASVIKPEYHRVRSRGN